MKLTFPIIVGRKVYYKIGQASFFLFLVLSLISIFITENNYVYTLFILLTFISAVFMSMTEEYIFDGKISIEKNSIDIYKNNRLENRISLNKLNIISFELNEFRGQNYSFNFKSITQKSGGTNYIQLEGERMSSLKFEFLLERNQLAHIKQIGSQWQNRNIKCNYEGTLISS